MAQPEPFEYRGHTVEIIVTEAGQRWHWSWISDKGAVGEVKESGARTEELGYQEARDDARAGVDAWERQHYQK